MRAAIVVAGVFAVLIAGSGLGIALVVSRSVSQTAQADRDAAAHVTVKLVNVKPIPPSVQSFGEIYQDVYYGITTKKIEAEAVDGQIHGELYNGSDRRITTIRFKVTTSAWTREYDVNVGVTPRTSTTFAIFVADEAPITGCTVVSVK